MRTLGVLLIAAVSTLAALADEPPAIESGPTLGSVRRIYLGDFGSSEGADLVREKVRILLSGSGRFTVVESPEAADAVLTGAAAIEHRTAVVGTTGYYGGSVNTYHSTHAQGTLRLVHVRSQTAIWFFESSRVWGFGDKAKLLARKIVDALLEAAARATPDPGPADRVSPKEVQGAANPKSDAN